MIELAVAVMVFTVGFGAISTTVATTTSLSRANQENAVALEAAQSVLDQMQTEDFEEIFVRYNRTVLDDPVGVLSPGAFFAVPGLNVRFGDPDGFVGEISFHGDGERLIEDVTALQLLNDVELGMPRDLNNDGVIDGADHSTDYNVLPVRIRLEWIGAAGEQSLEFVSVLTRRTI